MVDVGTRNNSFSERGQQPVHGWMFDADGVLFDAHDPNVKIPQITEFIISRLKMGEPVAINSGRAVGFSLSKLLPSLNEQGITNELLDHMLLVGQKGAEVGKFMNGKPVVEMDESMNIPDSLRNEVFDIINTQFSDTMFEGEIKPTMVSPQRMGPEQGKEVPIDEYHREQSRLFGLLQQLLVDRGLQNDYQVDLTNISIDIQTKKAGKGLGAQKIMEWMKKKSLFPQQFHAFGDSKSDQAMADEIHKEGHVVEFVWVGKRGTYTGKVPPYALSIPEGIHDEAVKNYFKSFENAEKSS